MAAGLVGAFWGMRLLKLFLPLICAELGYVLAASLTPWTGWATLVTAPLLIFLAGGAALTYPRWAAVVASGATWGLLGALLAGEVGLTGYTIWACALLLGLMGTALTAVSPATMTVLLTSLHGAAWMIVGFVGVAASLLPIVCATFQSWADDQPLVIPVILGMLVTTAYSCQVNSLRGDLRVGAVAHSRDPVDSQSR